MVVTLSPKGTRGTEIPGFAKALMKAGSGLGNFLFDKRRQLMQDWADYTASGGEPERKERTADRTSVSGATHGAGIGP